MRTLQVDEFPAEWDLAAGDESGAIIDAPLDPGSTMLIHTGADLGPIPVPSGLWWHGNGEILIDHGVGFADDMVGSPVTDAGTGFLVGFLVIDAGAARVALVGEAGEAGS